MLNGINNVTLSKPSTEAGFFPSFDIGLKPASHLEEAGEVMMMELLKTPPAYSQ